MVVYVADQLVHLMNSVALEIVVMVNAAGLSSNGVL